jgi:hypothetical protein
MRLPAETVRLMHDVARAKLRQMGRNAAAVAAEARVDALRRSVLGPDYVKRGQGATITVRVPRRFQR